MARRGKHRKKRDAHVPTDSFADIAFLLIIFFIFVTSLTAVKGFQSAIPSGEDAEQKEEEQEQKIELEDGVIRWNGEPIALEALRLKLDRLDLDKLSEEDPARVITIEPMGNDRWQEMYEVWAAVALAGGEVVIVTEEE